MVKLMFLVPRTSGGGAEKVITALASRFAEEADRYDVTLVTTVREDGRKGYELSGDVRYINIFDAKSGGHSGASGKGSLAGRAKKKVFNLLMKHSALLPAPLRERGKEKMILAQVDKVRALKEELKIDCAISFLNSANYINALSRAGERTIISVRSCPDGPYAPEDCRTPFGIRRLKAACAAADAIVPVSLEAGASLRDHFEADPAKMTVIYNAIDVEKTCERGRQPIKDAALEVSLKEAAFAFAVTGRLTEKKGQWHIIRAFREVVKDCPGAKLFILGHEGRGAENTAGLLKEAIRANGLEDKVILTGFLEDPYPVIARCDAYVMASFNEGFPNALTEAMALGLPVISTDCRSGPREILAPGTDFSEKAQTVEYAEYGILIPECSGRRLTDEPLEPEELSLAGAMKRLISDRKLREDYASKSPLRAGQFGTDEILEQWKTLIGETERA